MTTDEKTVAEAERPEEPSAAEGEGPAAESAPEASLADTLAAVAGQFQQIRGHLDRLLNIQLDRLKVRVRAGAFQIVLAVLFCAILLIATVVATVHAVAGLTEGLAIAFGNRPWLGNLVGGMGLLTVVLGGGFMVYRRVQRADLERLKTKYGEAPDGGDEP